MKIKGKTIRQFAQENGLSYAAVYQRMRAGWPTEKLNNPPESRDQAIKKASAARIKNLKPKFWERFWDKVDKDSGNGCWLWRLSVNSSGYAQVKRNNRAVMAHRIVFEKFFGPFDKNLQVCHRCDIPNCVNPDHLFLGTALDNVHDCMKKGRRRYRHGDTHHNAKLSDSDVKHIKLMLSKNTSTIFVKELAAKYGVHYLHLRNIQYGFRRGAS